MVGEIRGVEVISAVRSMPYAVTIGIIVGLLMSLFGPQLIGSTIRAYDEAFPVLKMHGKMVASDSQSVTLHITGEKIRGEECVLVSVYAYTIRADGKKHDALAERIDTPATGRLRDIGDYDIGRWRIFPVFDDALSVEVWTNHSCVGRSVLSKIADVSLRK